MSEYALRLANSQDTAARVRAADALGMTPNGTVRARGGLRPDGGGVVSIVGGTMNSQVTAFSCWVDASPAGQVGYPFVCDATKTLTHDPGDATLVRVDTIAVVIKENAFDGSGATSATLQIVKGTPGAGAPAMPTSACIPLRDVNVPAGASTGTGGMTSGALGSDRRKYTASLGGVVEVASQSDRDALTGVRVVYRSDLDSFEVKRAAGWEPISSTSAWTAVTFAGTWVNFGGTYQAVQYRKVGNTVKVRGSAKNGAANSVVFTLPAGFRPPADLQFNCVSAGVTAPVDVSSTGTVTITSSNTASAHLNFQFEV